MTTDLTDSEISEAFKAGILRTDLTKQEFIQWKREQVPQSPKSLEEILRYDQFFHQVTRDGADTIRMAFRHPASAKILARFIVKGDLLIRETVSENGPPA